jgi:hypothetical protein
MPFAVRDGTNHFGDEFSVLHMNAPLSRYVECGEQRESEAHRQSYGQIARTLGELGVPVRFIAVSLESSATVEPIPNPSLAVTSDAVERALADCEQLLSTRGATSGIDRVHTALHGYLLAVCARAAINVPEGAGATQVFKVIREHHQSFAHTGPQASEVKRIVHSIGNIIDALAPLRNRASLAHPNETVLGEPEAMLVLNSVRTLLHYLDSKLSSG